MATIAGLAQHLSLCLHCWNSSFASGKRDCCAFTPALEGSPKACCTAQNSSLTPLGALRSVLVLRVIAIASA
jgi:hypothetical protein